VKKVHNGREANVPGRNFTKDLNAYGVEKRKEMVKGIDLCLAYGDTIRRRGRTVPRDLGALRW